MVVEPPVVTVTTPVKVSAVAPGAGIGLELKVGTAAPGSETPDGSGFGRIPLGKRVIVAGPTTTVVEFCGIGIIVVATIEEDEYTNVCAVALADGRGFGSIMGVNI